MNNTLKLVVFDLDDIRYAMRLSQVERVVRSAAWTPLPEAPPAVIGVIDLAGSVIPLLNTRRRFRIAERDIGLDDQFLIARTARRTVALVVDRTRDILERCEKDITAAAGIAPKLGAIEGVVRLEDGLVLIHDLDKFLSAADDEMLQEALQHREDVSH